MSFKAWAGKYTLDIEGSFSGAAAFLFLIRVGATWPTVGWPEVIGLFLILCVHYGKEYIQELKPSGVSEELEKEVSQLRSDVVNLEAKMSGIELAKGITTSGSGE